MATNLVRIEKKQFKVWRFGLVVGRVWVSWHKGLHVYTKNVAASNRSHGWNFFNA